MYRCKKCLRDFPFPGWVKMPHPKLVPSSFIFSEKFIKQLCCPFCRTVEIEEIGDKGIILEDKFEKTWNFFQKDCPHCKAVIPCEYNHSLNFITAECPKCGAIYNIIPDFSLEVKFKPIITFDKRPCGKL